MRFFVPAIYAGIFAVAIYFALAQSPLPQAVASVPEGSAAQAQITSPKTGKRETCRQTVSAKHLKRAEARDQLQLCVAKARLDCLQQAIDAKYRGAARRVFVKSCVAA